MGANLIQSLNFRAIQKREDSLARLRNWIMVESLNHFKFRAEYGMKYYGSSSQCLSKQFVTMSTTLFGQILVISESVEWKVRLWRYLRLGILRHSNLPKFYLDGSIHKRILNFCITSVPPCPRHLTVSHVTSQYLKYPQSVMDIRAEGNVTYMRRLQGYVQQVRIFNSWLTLLWEQSFFVKV